VTFDVERGDRGFNAVNIKKLSWSVQGRSCIYGMPL
jgi:hypothetical protein